MVIILKDCYKDCNMKFTSKEALYKYAQGYFKDVSFGGDKIVDKIKRGISGVTIKDILSTLDTTHVIYFEK